MKTMLRQIHSASGTYQVLAFVCPGCLTLSGTGLHLLAVNDASITPNWDWNGSFENPTLSPSILTKLHNGVCHSFLVDGVFTFLDDSSHVYAGLTKHIEDLPEWLTKETLDDY